MIKCKNCNRYFKIKYDFCPKCGINSFSEEESRNNIIIKQENYNIPNNSQYFQNIVKKIRIFVATCMIIITLLYVVAIALNLFEKISKNMSFFESALIPPLPLFMTMTIIFLYTKKIVKRKNSLQKNGILIKNLNYEIISNINNSDKCKIKVYYVNEKQESKILLSDIKYNRLVVQNNITPTVDLLIDQTNEDNYYIDFEIY